MFLFYKKLAMILKDRFSLSLQSYICHSRCRLLPISEYNSGELHHHKVRRIMGMIHMHIHLHLYIHKHMQVHTQIRTHT